MRLLPFTLDVFVPNLTLGLGLAVLSACQFGDTSTQSAVRLTCMDDQLSIELIASHPELVTPIGLTIDDADHLYVLESHTHNPPQAYAGHSHDRIKKGIDNNKDGVPDQWIIFADSLEDGMNLAYGGNQNIFVVEKDQVLALRDNDQDGRSDEQKVLLKMSPPANVYDHAGLLGIAVAEDGWLYISRGNTGGQAWAVTGMDGQQISGYGDGGNVFRCKWDGSDIEEIATGFWNPFDIRFTASGRLLVTDNDPDSRGPNRLIEIVKGGDYGYQSLYGGSGIHPFLAWNGELPGTLPYAAALGEAPCGLLDVSGSNLPSEYANSILVSVWEENRIVRIPLQEHGSSVRGEAETLIQGDSSFHPVSFAVHSNGDIYFTDWVVRQYPNHGQGKLWRIRGNNANKVQLEGAQKEPHPLFLARTSEGFSEEELTELLLSSDVYVQAASRHALGQSGQQSTIQSWLSSDEEERRLQALLICIQQAWDIPATMLRRLMADKNKNIRTMTMIYLARNGRTDLLGDLEQALERGRISNDLIEAYLATIRHLQTDFIQAKNAQSEAYAKNLNRRLPEGYLLTLLKRSTVSPASKALILPYLEKPEAHLDVVLPLLFSSNTALLQASMMALRHVSDPAIGSAILGIALDRRKDLTLRLEAIATLAERSPDYCEEIHGLLSQRDESIRRAAMTYLCKCESWLAERSSSHQEGVSLRCKEVAERIPETEQWTQVVDGSGDAFRGKLVFQSRRTQCMTCHKVNGWGGIFGPDLSHIGSSKSRELLISSILAPSAQISPEWQGWYVKDQEGRTHLGRQIDVGLHNVELMLSSGEFVTFAKPMSYGMAASSLMPEGLVNSMNPQQFNDLIAYLESLQ